MFWLAASGRHESVASTATHRHRTAVAQAPSELPPGQLLQHPPSSSSWPPPSPHPSPPPIFVRLTLLLSLFSPPLRIYSPLTDPAPCSLAPPCLLQRRTHCPWCSAPSPLLLSYFFRSQITMDAPPKAPGSVSWVSCWGRTRATPSGYQTVLPVRVADFLSFLISIATSIFVFISSFYAPMNTLLTH